MISLPDVTILGFGALDSTGIHSMSGSTSWDEDQKGPSDIKRSQVLSKIYPSFGKLNLPDRLAFSVASLALSTTTNYDGTRTAITCGIPHGSFSTDRAYMESVHSGTPSPALFSATLPSSSIADIAIYYKIKGPDRVFAGTDSPSLSALESAVLLLLNGKCDSALFVSIWEHDEHICTELYDKNSGANSAIALHLALADQQSSSRKLHFHCLGNELSEVPSTEQAIFATILESLLHGRNCRIPVSESGFKGYISLV